MFVRTSNSSLNGLWTSWTIKMIVANTNLELLMALQSDFGGSIEKTSKTSDRCKQGYRLVWMADNAADLIERIQPYLIIKKKQAGYALHGFAVRNESGGKGKRKSEEVVFILNEFADKIKRLNQRGIVQ